MKYALPVLYAFPPSGTRRGDGIVFSSAVRFWRDVSGYPFADGLLPRMRTAIAARIGKALGDGFRRLPRAGSGWARNRLLADGLLDAESAERRVEAFLAEEGGGCAVVVGGIRTVCIAAVRAGFDLRGAFAQASAADDAVAAAVPYAFWPRAGYLAAAPEDVGLAFSAEATLHLGAAAELLDEEAWEATLAGAEKLGFEVESVPVGGAWNSLKPSGFARFAAVPAEGESEEDVLARTGSLVRELVARESGLREHLSRDREARAAWGERVRRAGTLARTAERCDAEEAFAWLADLRLAALLGMGGADLDALDRWLMHAQPFASREEECPPEEWARRVKEPLAVRQKKSGMRTAKRRKPSRKKTEG